MDAGLLIPFRRYGYRMIGATAEERAEWGRRRYLGAAAAPILNLGPQNIAPAGGSFEGETYTAAPATPAATPHTLTLHLGPTTSPAPAGHPLTLHLSPQTTAVSAPTTPAAASAPATTAAAAAPTIVATPACPACPTCTSPALAAGAGALGGGLLMYFVGLATRETKPKRRANRRR
jgi:hypothetical protein